MDLVYMSDVMAYQSVRGPVYDKYNSWDQPKNVQRNQNQQKKGKTKSKEPCKICQERQRRSLMKYIRQKSHDHNDLDIKEEDEETEADTEKKEETKR